MSMKMEEDIKRWTAKRKAALVMAITKIAIKCSNIIELSAISDHKSLVVLKKLCSQNSQKLALKLG